MKNPLNLVGKVIVWGTLAASVAIGIGQAWYDGVRIKSSDSERVGWIKVGMNRGQR